MTRDSDPELVSRLADQMAGGDLGEVARLFEANDVRPPTVLWEPDAGDMGSKPFDFLVGFWRARKGERRMPAEEAIDPVELRPALGRLLVCEPARGASDFRIRLYGSGLALEMGRDLTGTYISDFQPGSYITTFFLASYRAAALRGAPLYTRHAPSAASFAADIKRLLLPFGPGGDVTRILTGVETVTRRPLGRPHWAKRL